jgi:hypothetical protein
MFKLSVLGLYQLSVVYEYMLYTQLICAYT